MKLPLRYFLILCLVLGAVAVPVGWRQYTKGTEKKDAKKNGAEEKAAKKTDRRQDASGNASDLYFGFTK